MRRLPFLMILGFALGCFCSKVSGQQNDAKRVSIILSDTAVDVILQELERQSGYHFYYDKVQFDSMRVSIAINNQPLKRALEQLFENTAFHCTILADKGTVFITKGLRSKRPCRMGSLQKRPRILYAGTWEGA
ncbi:hypothetical protein [Paraflavitalea speifideaquila]|uniref:hypothetical protein n=1 Tax=Paraflavitalea speifideaquila TaxID=3076558 RepID=UPI0028E3543B|nr:hypothetical protein [Paraflavitalea speifideiaquila]